MLLAPRKSLIACSPAQWAFLQSPANVKAFVGGIGSGKSWVMNTALLLDAEPGKMYLSVAPTYDMARDISLEMIREVADMLGYWVRITYSPFRVLVKKRKRSAPADIAFRTAEHPDRIKGINASGAVIEEASLIDDDIIPHVVGRLRQGGQLGWLYSAFTPNGKSHWTYKRFIEEPLPGTEIFSARTMDAPHLSDEVKATILAAHSDRLARQELEGEFLDDIGNLLTYEQIASCFDNAALWRGEWPSLTGPLYIGFDVGRSNNLSVIWTWERVGDVAWCRECFVMRGVSYEQQKEEIARRASHRRVVKVAVDSGLAGKSIVDFLAPRIKSKLIDVQFTQHRMGEMAMGLANAIELRSVRLPSPTNEDDTVASDFLLVGHPTKSQNGWRLEASKVRESSDGCHADRFWAAALGLHGFVNDAKPRSMGGRPVGSPAGKRF